MRVSRRHWRHAESLFSAHARRRLDQRSRAHRSARHACRRRSRRGSWSVRRPRGQGAAEARAEGGRLVFYTPSHRRLVSPPRARRPTRLAVETGPWARATRGGGGGAGAGGGRPWIAPRLWGARESGPSGPSGPRPERGAGCPSAARRGRAARATAALQAKKDKTARIRGSAVRGAARWADGERAEGPRGGAAASRPPPFGGTPAAGVHAKPIAAGSSTSSLFFVRLGVELWGILGRPEASC